MSAKIKTVEDAITSLLRKSKPILGEYKRLSSMVE
jgi:hypothetical protein